MLDGSFAVSRRTWIDTEGSRLTKRPWSVGLDADNISLLIGTCYFMLLVVNCGTVPLQLCINCGI